MISKKVIRRPLLLTAVILLLSGSIALLTTYISSAEEIVSDFPIFYEGSYLEVKDKVDVIGFYLPVFGASRGVVNPEIPEVINGKKLLFKTPGEITFY